jgi:hypothetical protein
MEVLDYFTIYRFAAVTFRGRLLRLRGPHENWNIQEIAEATIAETDRPLYW